MKEANTTEVADSEPTATEQDVFIDLDLNNEEEANEFLDTPIPITIPEKPVVPYQYGNGYYGGQVQQLPASYGRHGQMNEYYGMGD